MASKKSKVTFDDVIQGLSQPQRHAPNSAKTLFKTIIRFVLIQWWLYLKSIFITPGILIYAITFFTLIASLLDFFGIHIYFFDAYEFIFRQKITSEVYYSGPAKISLVVFLVWDALKYIFKIKIRWTLRKSLIIFWTIPLLLMFSLLGTGWYQKYRVSPESDGITKSYEISP